MSSIYDMNAKGDVGKRIFAIARFLFKPRMIEDVIIGFGTPDSDDHACQGLVRHDGRQYIVTIEELKRTEP